jgi:hypothetical protein
MKGYVVTTITRTTHACTLEMLNPTLKAAIHAHAAQYRLADLETDVLMCCETVSVSRKTGLFSGMKTRLSAVYVTPNWLVWVEDTDQRGASAGSARLKNIDVRDFSDTASYAVTPDQGLNITGRYTDKNRTGIAFIGLGSDADGQEFRRALEGAVRSAGR